MTASANRVSRLPVLLVVSTLVLLGGCLSVGKAPSDHFYRLELTAPDLRFDSSVLPGTIQVTRPSADALTGERYLLYRENGQSMQVRHHPYHQWMDSPTLIIQQEIARYLRSSGLSDHVVTPEHRARVDYLLSCRIAKFERVLDDSPRVVMELEIGLTHMRTREPLLLQRYREEHPTRGEGVAASIEAYDQALAQILKRFVADASNIPLTAKVEESH